MPSPGLDRRLLRIASLLFASGMCALIYQVAWLRELRLIFGASTAASAAVLAIFMGGLGLGGALLGRRADRSPNPLRLYAHLELTIALAAAVTPFLLDLSRSLYVALGGASVLGLPLATLTRLLLSTLILALPTVLMGGTLPAAAKAVETRGDESRRKLAVLYGVNTFGAVVGVAVANFHLLELVGTRTMLLLAALLNLLVGIVGRSLSRSIEPASTPEPVTEDAAGGVEGRSKDGRPAWLAPFVYVAAAAAGFAFLLMEMVWYRMLAPLLGGTTFTFGLILAVALLGIGLGSAAYSLVFARLRPTLWGFAASCAAEALFIALPFALGDRLAFLAQALRGLGAFGFDGFVAAWSVTALLVVLPAAMVAGLQFPLLVALLGRGGHRVGRQLGLAYAWNTFGAIAGSLAGGFGLLAALSAPGTWRLVVVLLAVVGLVAASLELKLGRRLRTLVPGAAAAALSLLLIAAPGPTAVWRHSPVGAGRVELTSANPNGLRRWMHEQRRRVFWEQEGIESSVGLLRADSVSFLINGKSDGNAKSDAPTQVWLGLVGAVLHPRPRRSLVIGLGTGSSAGWMAAVEEMERVDVVELEPAVVEVARVCAPVNVSVLDNPKVRLVFGDAREVLLTTPERYDLIASEPSNPFRSGISSLYTREFYAAAAARLREDGIFMQWLQGYEVDNLTVETVVSTLASVFAEVEIWQTHLSDLLLVASQEPIARDVPRLRARVRTEPFRSALLEAWRTESLEGFLARFIASSSMSRAIAGAREGLLNTDDRNLVEFGFARTLGQRGLFEPFDLRRVARARGEHRPSTSGGMVNWQRVDEEQINLQTFAQVPPQTPDWLTPEQRVRVEAAQLYLGGGLDPALRRWRSQDGEPVGPLEVAIVAHSLAAAGDPQVLPYVDSLRQWQPGEADALRAILDLRQGRIEAAASGLEAAFARFRSTPWSWGPVLVAGLDAAVELAASEPGLARRMHLALREPFSLYVREDERLRAFLEVSSHLEPATTAAIFESLEPWVPWDHWHLSNRFLTYRAAGHPLASRAEQDLADYLRWERVPFGQGLLAAPTAEGE